MKKILNRREYFKVLKVIALLNFVSLQIFVVENGICAGTEPIVATSAPVPLVAAVNTNEAKDLFNEKDFEKEIAGPWTKILNKNRIIVYNRDVDGTKLLAFKAVGVLRAKLERVLAIMRNVENSAEWTPSLLKKETVKEWDDLDAITYSVTDIPWPFHNRALILHNKLKLDKKRKFLVLQVKSVSEKDYPVKMGDDVVLANMDYALFYVRRFSPEETFMEIYIHLDPKGVIPNWIVNFFQKSWPYEWMRAIEKRAKIDGTPIRPMISQLVTELDKI